MKLTGQQIADLQRALLSAFPHEGVLAQLVRFKLNQRLDAVAGGETLADVIFHLIEWSESVGQLNTLIRGAREENPGNELLAAFVRRLERAGTQTPLIALSVDATTDQLTNPQQQDAITNEANEGHVDELRRSISGFLLGRASHWGTPRRILRVLVVDDEESVLRTLKRMLRIDAKISVEAVSSGETAVAQLQHSAFDCIVTDLMMPGFTGFDLVKWIRARSAVLPVVAITGGIFGEHDVSQHEFDLLLEKPLVPEAFRNAIFEVCDGRLRLLLSTAFPLEWRRLFSLLHSCSDAIYRFLQACPGSDIFQTALRHKMKEIAHGYARDVSLGSSPISSTGTLLSRTQRLNRLIANVGHASTKGVAEYLVAVRTDFEAEGHPNVTFTIDISDSFRSATVRDEVTKYLLLAAIELIDNAKEAVGDHGNIAVSARAQVSECSVVLMVANSGTIEESLGTRIFEEGVSTKGDGRGMGLAILKRLARRFGGTIRLRQRGRVEFVLSVPTL